MLLQANWAIGYQLAPCKNLQLRVVIKIKGLVGYKGEDIN
jgi:hypothetical protein